MKLSYDPQYNIAYLRLREEQAELDTIRVSDELNIDLAPDGSVHGIEFLNANQQLASPHADAIEIVNQLTGQSAQLRLTGQRPVKRLKKRAPNGRPRKRAGARICLKRENRR